MRTIIEYASDLYPEKLRKIKKPPSRLYVEGNIENLNNFGIAVIGSRTNTKYGEKMCQKFVKGLVEYNINIISGLALGIDSIAHTTCLKNSGKTIAVLPSGLSNIYPSKHKELAETIIKNGGTVISEYENNIKADSKKFLERNRIVAGLSEGTLVVEGGSRSGTSVTARYTIEEGKPVFCIPSNLDSIKGITPNILIQTGSNLVTDANDILNFYKDFNFVKRNVKQKEILLEIPVELRTVYKTINNIPQDVNEITRKSGLSIGEVNYKILLLQLEDKVIEVAGHRFIRKEE